MLSFAIGSLGLIVVVLTSFSHQLNFLLRCEVATGVLNVEFFALKLNFLFGTCRVHLGNITGVPECGLNIDRDFHFAKELV